MLTDNVRLGGCFPTGRMASTRVKYDPADKVWPRTISAWSSNGYWYFVGDLKAWAPNQDREFDYYEGVDL